MSKLTTAAMLAVVVAALMVGTAQAQSQPPPKVQAVQTTYSIFSYHVYKCVVGVVAFVATNAVVAAALIKRAGGVLKVARHLLKLRSKASKLKFIASIAGELTGINGVVDACS